MYVSIKMSVVEASKAVLVGKMKICTKCFTLFLFHENIDKCINFYWINLTKVTIFVIHCMLKCN